MSGLQDDAVRELARFAREFPINEQATGLMAGAAVLGEALASVKAAVVRSQLLLRSP
jgi:hypothetical protein